MASPPQYKSTFKSPGLGSPGLGSPNPGLPPLNQSRLDRSSTLHSPEPAHLNRSTMLATDNSHSFTIRVFGFTPNKAQAVVGAFQEFGEIVRRTAGEGNWIDIEYKSPTVADAALTMNGKIISGVMIGVKRLDDGLNTSVGGGVHREQQRRRMKPKGVNEMNIGDWVEGWGATTSTFSGGARSNLGARTPVPQSFCSKVKEYILEW